MSHGTGQFQGRHTDVLGHQSLLPAWPEARVLEGAGQQGQAKLQTTERGLSTAGAWPVLVLHVGGGGSARRTRETERSLWKAYYVSSKSRARLYHVQKEEAHQEHGSRTTGAAGSPLRPAHLQPPSLSGCTSHLVFLGFLPPGGPSLICTTGTWDICGPTNTTYSRKLSQTPFKCPGFSIPVPTLPPPPLTCPHAAASASGSGKHVHSGLLSSRDLGLLIPVVPSGLHTEPGHCEDTRSADLRTFAWHLQEPGAVPRRSGLACAWAVKGLASDITGCLGKLLCFSEPPFLHPYNGTHGTRRAGVVFRPSKHITP